MENNKCREDFRFTQEYEEDYPNTNERYYENYQVADRYYNYPNKYKEPKITLSELPVDIVLLKTF